MGLTTLFNLRSSYNEHIFRQTEFAVDTTMLILPSLHSISLLDSTKYYNMGISKYAYYQLLQLLHNKQRRCEDVNNLVLRLS